MFRVSQQQYASGGDNTCEVQSLTFQDENPRSGLKWLCLAMTLSEGIVLRAGTIFRTKIQGLDLIGCVW